ncbi:hypothetical protein [Amycolatopsis sp. PS_44_ISF1]|uniref:hypothetical protein n=1 Tax=Amycolatopsis sp. PS_44_ISF1 TaxID=2974917 RepID=UPI0028DF7615|nr:hypothetical protein [Amycolatopsis sp. PS_44_ISF1]MDT8913578.1 hypothetical protein [Amycolatopsis sp. PS_44_ISF1]
MTQDTEPGALEARGRSAKTLPVSTTGSRPGTGDEQPERPRNAYARSWNGSKEDIDDAEVVGEWEPRDRHARHRLRDSARTFFGATTWARMADRARRRAADEERAAAGDDSLDLHEQLLTLRAETTLAGEKYMRSLRDSHLLVPGFSDDEREREFNVMHQVYMQMMMQGCLKPLARGVNPSTIIQAAGMMTAMRLLSPDFREEMNAYLQPFKDKIQDRIDARAVSMLSFAELQAIRHNDIVDARTAAKLSRNPALAGDEQFLAHRDGKKTDRNAYLSKRWQDRVNAMEHRDRGHREMFTPESAAMTEVALMENAFWRMRAPDTDGDEIYASYRAMRRRLRGQMAEDGLDRQEVVTRARMIIGERLESEPELRLMFNGMAHGRIVKAPAHTGAMTGTGRVHEVWTGEFEDQLGHPIPDDGMFTLRRPMDPDTHQAQLAETMVTSMLDGLQRDDQQAYAGSVMGYLVGFAARQEGLDTRGLPPLLRQRLDQAESMLASMAVDGLTSAAQQEVYSNAFADAMEEVAAHHPGVEATLMLSFGHDWPATLQDAVDDPVRFVHEQRTKPRVYYAGTEHTTQANTRFDWGYAARGTDPGEHRPGHDSDQAAEREQEQS